MFISSQVDNLLTLKYVHMKYNKSLQDSKQVVQDHTPHTKQTQHAIIIKNPKV
jgi:hypothetical protein